MSHQTLYRKYRPQKFSEIIGQEHVVRTLMNAISLERISHAYLFSGPRGSGKTTIARIFAKAINCENRKKGEAEPCGKCSSCVAIKEGKCIDLVEIDAASHRGIDEVRELREGVKFLPVKSKYKVFIIDEAHQLTKEAANALLKTLEEPPPHVVFILATTEVNKMIPTILSRCQRFEFRKLTIPEIVKRLEFICQKEKFKVVEKEALNLIGIYAGGSLRDAESILEQAINFAKATSKELTVQTLKDLLGIPQREIVAEFVEILAQKKLEKLISFLNNLNEMGVDLIEFTKALINYFRWMLVLKFLDQKNTEQFLYQEFTPEEIERLRKQSTLFSENELKTLLPAFLEAFNKIKISPIPQLPLELTVIEFLLKK